MYIELAAVMRAATRQTGDCAFDLAYARKIALAIRATVNEARRVALRGKRQCMAALLACDSQIATSLLPLGSVRWDPSPACSKLREEMSEFVSQRAIDLLGMLNQAWV